MKYGFEEKLSVISEITCGKGLQTVCRERHLDRHEVRNWLARFRLYGEAGLHASARCLNYTAAEKEKIILEHTKKGVPLSHLSLHYDVHRSTIKSWLRTIRAGGSLNVKRRGRPPKDPMARPKKKEPQTELERLQAENLRLRAENALLKKVKALVEEEQKARARLNGQKPSTN